MSHNWEREEREKEERREEREKEERREEKGKSRISLGMSQEKEELTLRVLSQEPVMAQL